MALVRCDLVEYGLRGGAPLDEVRLRAPGVVLLFPDVHETRDHALMPGSSPAPPPFLVVVLDATWSQARRMAHRVPALAALPRLALPPPPPLGMPKRLRKTPRPEGMATIEAIARAIALFEGEALAAPLDALHRLAITRSMAGHERPRAAQRPAS